MTILHNILWLCSMYKQWFHLQEKKEGWKERKKSTFWVHKASPACYKAIFIEYDKINQEPIIGLPIIYIFIKSLFHCTMCQASLPSLYQFAKSQSLIIKAQCVAFGNIKHECQTCNMLTPCEKRLQQHLNCARSPDTSSMLLLCLTVG